MGTTGKATNYLPDPMEVNAQQDILIAKANAEAASDPYAIGVEMFGQIASQIGPGMAPTPGAAAMPKAAYGKKYAYGGKTQMNVEGNEVVDDPTVGSVEMEGNSHDKGGIDVDVDPGTDVYSDKVLDEKGKSMAQRKKAREKARKSIVDMLEQDSLDAPRRNAYKRKISQLEEEEKRDLDTQEQAGMMAELLGMNHTGEDGYAKYGSRKKMAYGDGTLQGSASDAMGRLENDFNSQSDFEAPGNFENFMSALEGNAPRGGDVMKLFGNMSGAFGMNKNVENARAGDTAHTNLYKNVGDDAVDTLDNAGAELNAIEQNQRQNIRRNASANKREGRRTSRGINTMRATDAVTNMQSNMAELNLVDNMAMQKMGLDKSKAGVQLTSSQAKAKGAALARDNNDRDRDNYFSNKGAAIANMSKALQQTGKDLNSMALSDVEMELLQNFSSNFDVDKNGVLKQKKTK